jgi:hypothetical protein
MHPYDLELGMLGQPSVTLHFGVRPVPSKDDMLLAHLRVAFTLTPDLGTGQLGQGQTWASNGAPDCCGTSIDGGIVYRHRVPRYFGMVNPARVAGAKAG